MPHLPCADQLARLARAGPDPAARVPEGLTFGWLLGSAASAEDARSRPLNPVPDLDRTCCSSFLVPAQVTSPRRSARPAPKLAIRVLDEGSDAHDRTRHVFVRATRRSAASPSFRGDGSKPSTLVALAGPLRLRIVAGSRSRCSASEPTEQQAPNRG